jgi:drug/metabolite transporter (DMT)-like permease
VNDIVTADWFWGAFIMAFIFIIVFNLMALTAQRNGVSVASVASKMSVIIPVIFGVYMYNEGLGISKIIGVMLALLAVYLTASKSNSQTNLKKGLLLPILLFIGSGTIDTSIKYIETMYVPENGIPIFSATIFFISAIIGVLILIVMGIQKKFKWNYQSIIGGCVLGVVNFYSMFYLLKALQYEGIESSTIFTVNNVAIVMLSTLIALILFKERILLKNWIGIGVAIISIILVTLA